MEQTVKKFQEHAEKSSILFTLLFIAICFFANGCESMNYYSSFREFFPDLYNASIIHMLAFLTTSLACLSSLAFRIIDKQPLKLVSVFGIAGGLALSLGY